MAKFPQVHDGELVTPRMGDWRMQCCRCRLVHRFKFTVVRHRTRTKVQFRAWRVKGRT